MPKTAQLNITPRRATSLSKQSETPFQATPIARLWEKYQVALVKKRRISPLSLQDSRLEPIYESAYEVLYDIADAILKTKAASPTDLSIQAEIIIRRERDLGGPCTVEELVKFCRDIQTMAAGGLTRIGRSP